MSPCPACDQAAVVDENGCCVHCGADRSHEGERVAVALLLEGVDLAALEAWLATVPNLVRWEVHSDPAAVFAE